MERGGNGQYKKTKGNINILQLGSNVTDYTVLLEIYNFTDNEVHMRRIGQKLKAIFSLDVDCFTGHSQKKDYTLLQKQYKIFDLPKSATKKMDDVALMALNRCVVKRGKGNCTLQALCEKEGIFLRKPKNVRVGDVFGKKNGTLSKEAQLYCQLDVEAPLLLHDRYSTLTDLTKRLHYTDNPPVGSVVDIMSSVTSSSEPIAQGKVIRHNGKWASNGLKVSNKHVLVQITKVFNPRGVIHYPHDNTHLNKCSCGRKSHDTVDESCNFYMYQQLGKPPFTVIELKSRLRMFNTHFKYKSCFYDDAENSTSLPPNVENFTRGEKETQEPEVEQSDSDVIEDDDDTSTVASDIDEDEDGISDEALSPEAVQFLMKEAKDSTADDNEGIGDGVEPTMREVRMATDGEFNKTLQELIDEADRLSQSMNDSEPNDDDVPFDQLPKKKLKKTVLGDIFHFMDRAKLPMHHEYKALFFRSLRAAMFIMNKSDVEEVKKVLEAKQGQSWEKKMAFDFPYIAARVRRRAPPAKMLYHRLLTVFEFFKDKVDTKTNVKLFNDRNEKKFRNMLDLVKQGYASDPPHIAMYVPKTDRRGKKMVDQDGLQLYRSLRGTSNLESLHQYLTTSFGHTMSGPRYSDNLLAILRHYFNWRMSLKNRPNFPQLLHYDGRLIDRANYLYEVLFGYPKYRHWSVFNDNLPLQSSYGIVNIKDELTTTLAYTEEDTECLKKNKMLSYLAKRQNSALPFLPIRGEAEKRLAHKKLNEIVSNDKSMSNQHVYDNLAETWNTHHVNISAKVFPKLAIHFSRHVKRWQKNQDTKDAEVASGAGKLSAALEHIPTNDTVLENFQPTELLPTDESNTEISTPTDHTTETPTPT